MSNLKKIENKMKQYLIAIDKLSKNIVEEMHGKDYDNRDNIIHDYFKKWEELFCKWGHLRMQRDNIFLKRNKDEIVKLEKELKKIKEIEI